MHSLACHTALALITRPSPDVERTGGAQRVARNGGTLWPSWYESLRATITAPSKPSAYLAAAAPHDAHRRDGRRHFTSVACGGLHDLASPLRCEQSGRAGQASPPGPSAAGAAGSGSPKAGMVASPQSCVCRLPSLPSLSWYGRPSASRSPAVLTCGAQLIHMVPMHSRSNVLAACCHSETLGSV